MEGNPDGIGHVGEQMRRYDTSKALKKAQEAPALNAQGLLKPACTSQRFFGTCQAVKAKEEVRDERRNI